MNDKIVGFRMTASTRKNFLLMEVLPLSLEVRAPFLAGQGDASVC